MNIKSLPVEDEDFVGEVFEEVDDLLEDIFNEEEDILFCDKFLTRTILKKI